MEEKAGYAEDKGANGNEQEHLKSEMEALSEHGSADAPLRLPARVRYQADGAMKLKKRLRGSGIMALRRRGQVTGREKLQTLRRRNAWRFGNSWCYRG